MSMQALADILRNFYNNQLLREEDGATAIEYGLIAGGISIAIVASVMIVGEDLSGLFSTIGSTISSAHVDNAN